MLTSIAKLSQMSAKKLHNTLMEEYPNDLKLRQSIKARIRESKGDARAAKIKRTQQLKAWAPLVHQAYKAINTPKARVKKAEDFYASPMGYGSLYEAGFDESPSKLALDTYLAYTALIQKVTDKLRSHRDAGTHTPLQLAREKGIPNDGEHWSDWIPENIKAATARAFERLNEDHPMELFPRVFYAPPKARPYQPRPAKKERPLSRTKQLNQAIMEADELCMDKPTPENMAQRDALILEKEKLRKEKRREYAKTYQAKVKAAVQAFKQPKGESSE
jgi:hypothetical protein